MKQELTNKKKELWINEGCHLRTKERYEPWLSEREFSGQGALVILKVAYLRETMLSLVNYKKGYF